MGSPLRNPLLPKRTSTSSACRLALRSASALSFASMAACWAAVISACFFNCGHDSVCGRQGQHVHHCSPHDANPVQPQHTNQHRTHALFHALGRPARPWLAMLHYCNAACMGSETLRQWVPHLL